MKLELHLVPASSFAQNLRKQLGDRWTALSRRVRSEHDWTCELCGWKENRSRHLYTNLHEVWEYDDEAHVQKLIGFECVCGACHGVHHWGHSRVSGKDLELLTEHACNINDCTRKEWEEHVQVAFVTWGLRSQFSWKLDLGDWESLADPISKANNITWV